MSDLDSPTPSEPPFRPLPPITCSTTRPPDCRRRAPGLSEGLPAGFRMRHDARRAASCLRCGALPRAPERRGGRRGRAPGAHDAGARLDPAAARELTRHLGAIASCLHVLADSGRSLRERALTDLARTELQRATCFVQGLQVLGEDPVLTRRSLRLVELIEQALGTVEPERRLAGVEAVLDVSGVDVVRRG